MTLPVIGMETLSGLAANETARLINFPGLAQRPERDPALREDPRGNQDQKTRDRYARFQGLPALRDALASLPPLACAG